MTTAEPGGISVLATPKLPPKAVSSQHVPKQSPIPVRSNSRAATNLGDLSRRFVEIISSANGPIDITDVAQRLNIRQRRIYDVTNVLEGCGYIVKEGKKMMTWTGPTGRTEAPPAHRGLHDQMAALDREIAAARQDLETCSAGMEDAKLYVAYEDIVRATGHLTARVAPNFEQAGGVGQVNSVLDDDDCDGQTEGDAAPLTIVGLRAVPGSEMVLSTDSVDRPSVFSIDIASDQAIHCCTLTGDEVEGQAPDPGQATDMLPVGPADPSQLLDTNVEAMYGMFDAEPAPKAVDDRLTMVMSTPVPGDTLAEFVPQLTDRLFDSSGSTSIMTSIDYSQYM